MVCLHEIIIQGIDGIIDTVKQNLDTFLFVTLVITLIILAFIVAFATTIYDLRLRSKVLKKRPEKKSD
jgi:hypothetical protein